MSDSKENKHIALARKPPSTEPEKGSFFTAAIQAKLTINQPGDKYEQEADSVADKVMHMEKAGKSFFAPASVQRKCAACEKEEIKRKEGSQPSATPAIGEEYITALSGGQPLTRQENDFYQSHLGFDFSNVRLHVDAKANESAQQINALAYTFNNHIVFGANQYSPGTASGKHLLAHELTHVLQQKGMHTTAIQRCPAGQDAQYDTVAAQIRALPLYRRPPWHSDANTTPARARQIADQIIRDAKPRDDCMYYINYLHTLFSIPENPASSVSAQQGPVLQQAAQDEQTRLQDPQAQTNAQYEETISGAVPAGNWTRLRGQDGVHYYVDRTDATNIVVKVKVRLTGRQARVAEARSLEDAVEKHANTAGYTIDLQFVNRSGHDVFQAEVDPSEWATSGNWVGTPDVMAHELHHLLDLPDRYNYIEAHSGNADMYICNRIYWFLEQFNRGGDPNRYTSFMGEGNLVTDADACQVAEYTNQADCMSRRQAIRQPFNDMKMRALAKCLRVRNLLSEIVPGAVLDPRNPGTAPADTSARVRQIAESVFGFALSDEDIDRNVRNMEYQVRAPLVQMLVASSLPCGSGELHWQQSPSAYVVCPAFLALSLPDQQQLLMKQSHLIYQNVSGEFVMDRIRGIAADESTAQKWAQFVLRVANEV